MDTGNDAPNQQSMTVQQAIDVAVKHHSAGELSKACPIYQKILETNPDHPIALHLFGLAAYQAGNLEVAEDYISKAIVCKPDYAEAHNNLGLTYQGLRKLDKAKASYENALGLNPNIAEACNNLGVIVFGYGQIEAAIVHYIRAIEIRPEFSEAHGNLGRAYRKLNRLSEAAVCYQKSLSINPNSAETYNDLANIFMEEKCFEEAINHYQKAISISPHSAKFHNSIGIAYRELHNLEAAIENYLKALSIAPDFEEANHNLGNAYKDLGDLEEAIGYYRNALRINPNLVEALNNLGIVYRKLGQHNEAVECYRDVLSINPDFDTAHRNLIYAMAQTPSIRSKSVLEETQLWAQKFSFKGEIADFKNTIDPDRKLRVGYLSADFREHAVGYLLESLLSAHHKTHFQIFCYAEVQKPDQVTERFKNYADQWRQTVGLDDEELAELIRQDEIDILVECTGFTKNTRLISLSRKPAPIQVNYFPLHGGTSGLSAIDYAFSDPVLTPKKQEEWFSEKVVSLAHGSFVFQPDTTWPDVEQNPKHTEIVFGCVGDPARVDSHAINLWAELLEMFPGSHLLFKHKTFNDEKSRNYWQTKFKSLGDKAIYEGIPGGWHKHMDVYARLSVVLDTLPISGGTSCVIPMWMGVPVITLVKDHYHHRFGAAMLSHAGMPEFCAKNEEEYLRIIKDLLNDSDRISAFRTTSRNIIRSSHLMDVEGLTLGIEQAYKKMWKTWCETRL